ncbi:N-6 DNA methylase [uncultured Tissierella sp.]|uniref:N-6 DNA methylase n=1 Tax=uncultured Tissierella sp. TaxID=448160 RepID=UPI002804DB31|nr:N-6 DNA methylase [uncultured Tissierella sp.]MDU5082731.1 N-6 DNA methylase [Bacillota bacterium]
MNNLDENLYRLTLQLNDDFKGIINSEDGLLLDLGLFTIVWLDKTKKNYGWIIPDIRKFKNKDRVSIDFSQELMMVGQDIEKMNPKFNGIFSELCFSKIYKVSEKTCWSHFQKYFREVSAIDCVQDTIGAFIQRVMEILLRKDGEQFTPNSIRSIMAKLLNIEDNAKIADPFLGIGSNLIEVHKSATELDFNINSIQFYGQEKNSKIYLLAKLNFLLSGVRNFDIRLGDSIRKPEFIQGNTMLKVDYILSDIPFGLRSWGYEEAMHDSYSRFKYGVPSKSLVEWVIIQHIVASLKDDGKAVVTIPKGPLFRANEYKIRQGFVEDDLIECIIELPDNLYATTNIPVNIVVFNKDKPLSRKEKILLIDASRIEVKKEKGQKVFSEEQLEYIADIYHRGLCMEDISRFIICDTVRKHGYNLNLIENLRLEDLKDRLTNMIELRDVAEKIFRGVQIPKTTFERAKNGKDKSHYVLNLSDINEVGITLDNNSLVEPQQRWIKNYELKQGDVILSARGTVIKSAVVEGDLPPIIASGNLVVIRLKKNKYNSYLLKFYLDSPLGKTFLEGLQTGTSVNVINSRNLEGLMIPKVDIQEQASLAQRIIENEETYKEAIRKAEQQRETAIQNLYQELGIINQQVQNDTKIWRS